MRASRVVLGAAVVMVALSAGQAWAQVKVAEKVAAAVEGPYVVAVLNFDVGAKEIATFGEVIPDLLTAYLTADANLQLVERAQVKKILEELVLGQTGIVDEATKAKIGNLTGAKFLITGRAFIVGKDLFITAKVMSTETSKVGAQVVKGGVDGKLDDIVQGLAKNISAYMAENAKAMMPKVMTEQDIIAALQKKLEGKTLPKFAVGIPERHVGRATVDPAAETEVSFLLKSVGATLISTKDGAISGWARDFLKEPTKEFPASLREADILIVGEGFSEFAGTTERLLSVKARVELKAVDLKTGRILAVGRATATAVDLAENIAGKSALQKAAGEIALKLIPEAVEEYNKAAKAAETKPARAD